MNSTSATFRSIGFILLILSFFTVQSQEAAPEKLKIFIDCGNSSCDEDFFRTELSHVNHLRDRVASDVHILLSGNRNASEGISYQMIFYGQKSYSQLRDTLRFSTLPNSTEVEIRERMAHYMNIGLVPFLIKNGNYENISVDVSKNQMEEKDESIKDDKWNYWVFNIGGNGSLNLDRNYENYRFSGNLNANRVTEKSKISFRFGQSYRKNVFFYEVDGEEFANTVENRGMNFDHTSSFAINDNWSYGYILEFYRNPIFSNYKSRINVFPALEYSIFPYDEFNNRLVTFRYMLGAYHAVYDTTTIYSQNKELLPVHRAELGIDLTQKWGSINLGLNYQQYLHNTNFYNLGLFGNFEIRISGGLFIYSFVYAELARDQINIYNESRDPNDVLTRKRELQSAYNMGAHFGINYRFGSKLNNFVNPRFNSGGNFIIFN